jgi:hypothetical protein
MKRRMKGARATAGGGSRVAVNVRVRVYPGTDGTLSLWLSDGRFPAGFEPVNFRL